MIRATYFIGIFPIVGLGVFALLKQERKYQHIADEINRAETYPTNVKQANDPAIFDIPSGRIRYIEAMQNYIKIGHINSDGQLRERTERATLKSISNEGLGNAILRCHRSFLVNRESIISTSGNAQGLLLSLSDCEKRSRFHEALYPFSAAFNAYFSVVIGPNPM